MTRRHKIDCNYACTIKYFIAAKWPSIVNSGDLDLRVGTVLRSCKLDFICSISENLEISFKWFWDRKTKLFTPVRFASPSPSRWWKSFCVPQFLRSLDVERCYYSCSTQREKLKQNSTLPMIIVISIISRMNIKSSWWQKICWGVVTTEKKKLWLNQTKHLFSRLSFHMWQHWDSSFNKMMMCQSWWNWNHREDCCYNISALRSKSEAINGWEN